MPSIPLLFLNRTRGTVIVFELYDGSRPVGRHTVMTKSAAARNLTFSLLLGTHEEMNTNKHHEGFSLVELLIVVAIIGIIAAIAIPNLLASKRAANEGSAIASIRTITSAEATYQSTTAPSSYGNLSQLNTAGLVDSTLSGSTILTPKSGYAFTAVPDTTTPNAQYLTTASTSVASGPTATGNRNFASDSSGLITYAGASTTAMTSNNGTPIGN
jgi:type IV pilus assembly protein PilA